jgi:hypothetical protein
MKCNLLVGLTGLVIAGSALAQTTATYRNDGYVIVPPLIAPNIDAGTFINNGQFIINFTNAGFTFPSFTENGVQPIPYETQNTMNFTNLAGAFMSCNVGFRFEFSPPAAPRQRTGSFVNAGTINMATVDTTNYLVKPPFFPFLTTGTGTTASNIFFIGIAGGIGTVNADHIVNPGVINMGFESVLRLQASSIDLSHGTLSMEQQGFSRNGETLSLFFNGGIFDGYWNIGDVRTQPVLFYPNGISPAGFFEGFPPTTPVHPVTQRDGTTLLQQLSFPDALTYLRDETDISGTNRYVRCVFISNTNQNVGVNVYFPGNADFLGIPDIWLEYTNFLSASTNLNVVKGDTNNVYVPDFFGALTNFFLDPNGFAGARVTAIPDNFNPVFANPSPPFPLGPPEQATTIPLGTFNASLTTNQWAAYEALLLPTSIVLTDIGGRNPTNVPGRIDIEADDYLDLSHTHIASLNHLLLEATNHFVGSPDSRISAPLVDINLRSTNGLIEVTNLLAGAIPRWEGTIKLYAARWTNETVIPGVIVITNHYHVLFARSDLSPIARSLAQDLILRTTGSGNNDTINIYDALHVTRSFLLDAARITIETNGPGAADPSGGILLTDPGIVWSTSAPRLQYFTNNGYFQTFNAVYFGGNQTSPYSPPITVPYQAFVNTGTITNFGSQIQSKFFENNGIVNATGGSIDLYSQTSILTNGVFIAPSSIGINASSLQISNHLLQSAGPITLSVSYYLDDGTITAGCPELNTNKNFWSGKGINLPTLPTYANLQSTTFTNTDPANALVVNTWAGVDKQNSPSGFDNNAAIGRLILDGRDPGSTFAFNGASSSNAIYIDYLEFDNYATQNVSGVWREVNIASNMKVYFAQAVQNGVSIAEKLNGANGGRFQWVSNYNCGFFSSTNLVYPDGSTNRVNTALATSCNIDSDSDGVVNCADLSPIPPGQLAACGCNSVIISIPTSFVATNGSGSGSGSGVSAGPGSKLDFPTVAGGGQSNAVAFASGSYSGLFYETNGVAIPSSGYFTAVTTTRGTYVGKVSSGGHTYPFAGQFDPATGLSSTTVSRGLIRALTLHLQLDSAANQIRGSVSDGRWTADLMADKLVFSKSAHPNQVGAYTFLIPGDSQDDNGPAGYSIGTVNVDGGGNVTWSGALADGSKVTQKSALSADGIWPLYSSLYSGKGAVLGWIQFTTNNIASGDVVWVKPSGVSSQYPGGFTNLVTSFGSPYQKPAAGTRVLDWSDGLGQFSISGGGLNQAWTNQIRLELNNRVTSLSGPKLTLSITPTSGLFRGTFVDPDSHKSEPFQGVLFQDINIGVGYFLGSGQSGEIRLEPAQ